MKLCSTRLLALLCVPAVALACDSPGGDGSGALGDDAVSASGGGDVLGGDTTTEPGAPAGPAPLLAPDCVDGQFTETLPNASADVSALVSSYQPAAARAFLEGVLEARYPFGAYIVKNAPSNPNSQPQNCWAFLPANPDLETTLFRASTMVHECGHFLDSSLGSFSFSGSTSGYMINQDITFECAGGDARERGGSTFARSMINGDDEAPLLPDDFYKDVYLDGSPDNGFFESGDQGFNSLMEEAVQYVNSLATDYALADLKSPFFSNTARDGALTFMWYVARYLRLARTQDSAAYDFLLGDPCWRGLILTVWGRAWTYLDITEGMSSLGISDAAIKPLATNQKLIDEIDRVRKAHGCN